MTTAEELAALSAEIDARVARMRVAAANARTTVTASCSIEGDLGRVVVDGLGALIDVELDRDRLSAARPDVVGPAIVAAVAAAESAVARRRDATIERAAEGAVDQSEDDNDDNDATDRDGAEP